MYYCYFQGVVEGRGGVKEKEVGLLQIENVEQFVRNIYFHRHSERVSQHPVDTKAAEER